MSYRAIAFGAVSIALAGFSATAQDTVFVIRHSEQQTDVASDDPELRTEGTERATFWADVFKPSGLDIVITSEFRRSRDTGAKIAEALDLPSVVIGKYDYQTVVEYLKDKHSEDTVLIVGHSGTISPLLQEFGHPEYSSVSKADYGGLFIVTPIENAPPVVTRISVDFRGRDAK